MFIVPEPLQDHFEILRVTVNVVDTPLAVVVEHPGQGGVRVLGDSGQHRLHHHTSHIQLDPGHYDVSLPVQADI